jgi:hypothetical protein
VNLKYFLSFFLMQLLSDFEKTGFIYLCSILMLRHEVGT